jgi:heterodisulfide reductase subunit A-like polyferredoxin
VTSAGERAPVGAVLVVGGGIGGMQAALDLAEAGFKVYLVEEKPAIGGVMAQLDKTFPTNDCAMCILSPKLVGCGRHLNIEIITNADLRELHGEPGRFTAVVEERPRFVDPARCTACGDCAEACPISVPDLFNAGLAQRRAAYKLYPQATPNAFAIEKRGTSPCREACPLHQRSQGYVALIRERRYQEAYRSIKEDNPFPGICGRICKHFCEEECSRGLADAPVSIMALKRFVVDRVWSEEPEPVQRVEPVHEERVAVIGAGPAGLTAAHDLVRLGYPVTVFEALPVAGGMMRVGVPAHRLPPAIVEREMDDILALGVDLRLNSPVDDLQTLVDTGYQAVFIAVGAHGGRRLPIPGAGSPDCWLATEFLRRVALDDRPELGGRHVIVLGGGPVAIDVAQTAVRLGAAAVQLACLESREQMPASPEEMAEAEEEGIAIHPGCTFLEVTEEQGQVTGVRCQEVDFRGFHPDGRPDMDVRPATEHLLAGDLVIFAIGQAPELGFLRDGSMVIQRGWLVVDPETLETPLSSPPREGRRGVGVFGGGDVVVGAGSVAEAIAAGHRAARSIHRYLREDPAIVLEPPRQPPVELSPDEVHARLATSATRKRPRAVPQRVAPDVRRQDFREMVLALDEEAAVREAERCLACGTCSECLACQYACQPAAIDHTMTARRRELAVGAVVLAPGADLLDPYLKEEYGYGRYPNVVTSVEFERLLSASGPYGGHVQRPSDGAEPRRIAWLQCIGSRDIACGRPYCSSVCCMYAIKEAVIAREHLGQVEATIFYLDIRAFGKDFDRYVERARTEHGVRFVRTLISGLKEDPKTHDVVVRYARSDGRPREETFDLAVLSLGLQPGRSAQALAGRLGLAPDGVGFPAAVPLAPTETLRPGVFAIGTFSEPKDIPETVIEASCAAARASALLAPSRGTLTLTKTYPPERDVWGIEERVGVFVCHCGINIGLVVDVPQVVEYARTLPGVAYAEHNLYTCSQDTQARIRELIQEHGLNRIVVASCTPRTHEPLFQDTIREAGLNRFLFEMTNLREQDSWVHRHDPAAATGKAEHLVAMAVAKARLLVPISRPRLTVEPSVLVVGGGAAGLTAALAVAEQGFGVHLVERESQFGGHLRHIHRRLGGGDPQELLRSLVARVEGHPRIQAYTGAAVAAIAGHVGRFETTLRLSDGTEAQVSHGAVIVATGARAVTPDEYLYGHDSRVLTQAELEERLVGGPVDARRVVMIQCVGSRDGARPYCSRFCCAQAIKNAIGLKEARPEAEVVVLYRDIRTYGLRELHYHRARELGVLFFPYEVERKPRVWLQEAGLQVEAETPDGVLKWQPDLIVLSSGVEPGDNRPLAQMLKVPLSEDGFFLEAHVKLRPIEFAADGIYLCGLAHSPRDLEEAMAQAYGAAVRAVALLARGELEAAGITATVNERLCAGCGVCVTVCPYGARQLDDERRVATVVDVLCQGCGACCVACPSGASQQKGFEKRMELAKVEAALA